MCNSDKKWCLLNVCVCVYYIIIFPPLLWVSLFTIFYYYNFCISSLELYLK